MMGEKILQIIVVTVVLVAVAYYFVIYSNKELYETFNDQAISKYRSELDKNYPSSPSAVVSKYLEVDSEGAYLSEKGRAILRKMNSRNLFIQQELKVISIISGYNISESKVEDGKATVLVIFDLVGEVEDYYAYRRKAQKEKIEVKLKRYDDRWVIISQIYPRIDVRAYREYLNTKSEDESEKFYRTIQNKGRS